MHIKTGEITEKNKIILVHQTLEVEQRQSEAASWLPW